MQRYLVFAPLGADPQNPMILGGLPVPGCFTPNDAFIGAAEARGLDLFIMEGPPDALAPALVEMGHRLLDRCSADPVMTAHLN